MNEIDFDAAFKALTDNRPFPWQQALYKRFITGDIPSSCSLPTGLGKTSVIAVWLIALATHPEKMPRRLVYVVNRRTVVDQTTEEVEKYLNRQVPGIPEFVVSTLRGQFADNREWSADPSRPAVISGTVDMIGSRLLFSGYGVGMKGRPLHAGFLGQDVLLVHDEAHLEPAFQELVKAIENEQKRCKDFRPIRVMEMTATSRGQGNPFGLTETDRQDPTVQKRITARKSLHFHELKDEKKLAEQVAELALEFKDSGRAVLVFVRTVEDVMKVRDKLMKEKQSVETLTGTRRGKERDELAENPIFQRFLPKPSTSEETAYLVCTSAGEVGVNISADHLVCDLSTFDSMAQRFGRVNRFGDRDDTRIVVVYPKEFKDDDLDERREKTLAVLRLAGGDGSPASLGNLHSRAVEEGAAAGPLSTDRTKLLRESILATFAPPPTILPTSDILFDAWALTTIRDKLPGRPLVEPYLHGVAAWQPPETQVAWREEVERLHPKYKDDMEQQEREPEDRQTLAKLAAKLLEDYPLKPHELLREPSYRAFKQFQAMAKRCPKLPVWLLDDDGKVQVMTVADLADKDQKERIEGRTILLPPSAGGLDGGILNGITAAPESDSLDVADEWYLGKERQRVRLDENKPPPGMRLIRRVPLPGESDETDPEYWFWFEVGNQGDTTAKAPVEWHVHVRDVVNQTRKIVANLALPKEVEQALIFAAEWHDHGKRRKLFQTILGNPDPSRCIWAKSGAKSGSKVEENYRHELGSLLEVDQQAEWAQLSEEQRDLVVHLIAAHHGRARPHFPADEIFDPERPQKDAEKMALAVPQRFARLQRKYGRWGLAYLESLLRAADWAASANVSSYLESAQ